MMVLATKQSRRVRSGRHVVAGDAATRPWPVLCSIGLGLLSLVILPCACTRPSRPTAEISLGSIDGKGLSRVIAEHRGRIVLVDFWATWCGPCVELFPHTVKLQERWGDRGLSVITVSLDDVDNRVAVVHFLGKQRATAGNFLSTYGVGPTAFTEFGIEDGSLPHLRLYDRQGKVHQTFASGGTSIDPEAVDRAVETMLE
jgi:thiol-disulfide isomerase/thioredoxin